MYSVEKVRQYMQEFFDNAYLLLSDKADQSMIVELCLLCVHCLEVLYMHWINPEVHLI